MHVHAVVVAENERGLVSLEQPAAVFFRLQHDANHFAQSTHGVALSHADFAGLV